MATITAAQISFEKKPWRLWLLNNAHHVVVRIVMGAIVTARRRRRGMRPLDIVFGRT